MSDINPKPNPVLLTPEQEATLKQAAATGEDLLSVWDTMEKMGAQFPFTKAEFTNIHSFITKTLSTFGSGK